MTHNYPDPDAIAAAYTFKYIAKKFYGINSKIVYSGFISRIENRHMTSLLRIRLHRFKLSDLKKYSHVALVDTQPLFANNPFPNQERVTVVIDQHPYETKPLADLSIVETNRGATCEILAEALLSLSTDIPSGLATGLVYGILTDTLNLSRADQPKTFDIYMSLLPFCDMKKLIQLQNPPHPVEFFANTGKAIYNASMYGTFIYCHLGFIKDPVLVAHIADFLLTYQKARWSLCTGRNNSTLYVSLRCKNHKVLAYDVLRDVFDHRDHAGGHGTIAGGSIDVGIKPSEQLWRRKENNLTKKLSKRLRVSNRTTAHYPFRDNKIGRTTG